MSYHECLPSSFGLSSLGEEGLPLLSWLLYPVVCMERSGVLYHGVAFGESLSVIREIKKSKKQGLFVLFFVLL